MTNTLLRVMNWEARGGPLGVVFMCAEQVRDVQASRYPACYWGKVMGDDGGGRER